MLVIAECETAEASKALEQWGLSNRRALSSRAERRISAVRNKPMTSPQPPDTTGNSQILFLLSSTGEGSSIVSKPEL